jgi:hypothetical protein
MLSVSSFEATKPFSAFWRRVFFAPASAGAVVLRSIVRHLFFSFLPRVSQRRR